MFAQKFFALVGNASGVAAVIGDRFYPGLAPQGVTRPYCVYTRVASDPQNSLGGFTGNLERVRVQVDCYAETFDSAVAIAAAVRAAVDAGGTGIKGVCINEQDAYENDPRLFRRMVEFSVFHRS